MPRRIPDYPDSYAGWNYISSLGSIISGIATLIFIYVMYDLFAQKIYCKKAYWNDVGFFLSDTQGESSNSLEWSLDSPPTFHVYREIPLSHRFL